MYNHSLGTNPMPDEEAGKSKFNIKYKGHKIAAETSIVTGMERISTFGASKGQGRYYSSAGAPCEIVLEV